MTVKKTMTVKIMMMLTMKMKHMKEENERGSR